MFKKIIVSLLIIVGLIMVSSSVMAAGISINIGTGTGSGGWSLGSIGGFGLPDGSITGIVINILDWILMIFGVVGIIGFVISGLMYILSSGDDDMIEKAKTAMKYSIIGVLVGLAGFVAIQAIDAILSVGYTI
jgi:cytochrome bd-type quinol oxidase subunit 2